MAIQYKQGGTTSDLGEQLNDFHYSLYAIEAATASKTFSSMGERMEQPKHYGSTLKCYKESPIIHDSNVNNQGIDADGVKMTQGKWYSWDTAGVRAEHDTKAAAKGRANLVRIESGNGNLGGSDRDFLVQQGAIPLLSENGGDVNGVGLRREVVEARIHEYGMALKFTKRELEMDTQIGLLTKFSKRLGEAQGTMRERQIRNGLLQAGLDNVVYGGDASTRAECDYGSQISGTSLRLIEHTLDLDLCPTDTKVLSGSTNVDTKVAPASRFAFMPYEMKSAIEDSVGANGKDLFVPVEQYTDSASFVMKEEFGRIGRFRFVLVHDMPHFAGVGADVDAADADLLYSTNGKYDLFPILVVGEDSFATMSLEGDNVAQVITVVPKADATNDKYGKRGSVAIAWYFGMIIKRPERIKVGLYTAKRM